MRKLIYLIVLLFLIVFNVYSQDTSWTKSDKEFLIDNFSRTQNEINIETNQLTPEQWSFRESKDAWSIAEVLEHLNMWQLVTQEHIRFMFYNGRQPDLIRSALTDSAATSFIYEDKKHTSPDFTVPTGKVPEAINLQLFNAYCDRIIENIRKSDLNFRLYFRKFTDGYMTNMNQAYIIQYGHVDRHLRQIKRIKSDANFPK